MTAHVAGVGQAPDVDLLLSLADEEIAALKRQLAEAQSELAYYKKLTETLAAENRRLYEQVEQLSPPPLERPLKGLKIAVVGRPNREADYRRVIEQRLGGTLLFASGEDKMALVYRQVQKAHGTVYITSFGSHKAKDQIELAAATHNKPVVYTDQTGLVALESVVLNELLPKIRERLS